MKEKKKKKTDDRTNYIYAIHAFHSFQAYSLGSIYLVHTRFYKNAVSSKIWGNVPSSLSIKSDIQHKKVGGLENNLKYIYIYLFHKKDLKTACIWLF